jgi:hypothetical protein
MEAITVRPGLSIHSIEYGEVLMLVKLTLLIFTEAQLVKVGTVMMLLVRRTLKRFGLWMKRFREIILRKQH